MRTRGCLVLIRVPVSSSSSAVDGSVHHSQEKDAVTANKAGGGDGARGASPTGILDGHNAPAGFSDKAGKNRAVREWTCKHDGSLLEQAWTFIGLTILMFAFCIFAPVAAIGWIFLPLTHGMWHFTAFAIAYTVTQNLPKWYSRSYKDGPVHSAIIATLATYVSKFKMIKECDLDPSKNYVFAWHPHGRLFYGFGMLIGLFSQWFPEIAEGGRDIFGGVNDTMFRVPFVSNWLYLIGLIECNKRSVCRKLKHGDSVGLIVGGIDEVLEGTFDDRDVLFLKNRKGFCKIAMDNGSGVVPCYCYGENSLYQHEPSFVLNFWRWVNRFVKLGAPLPIRGVWGTPFPKREPLLVVFGKPLFAEEGESVDAFHKRYMDALVALHAKYVSESGCPDKKLVIV